jgi:hypothetical protein
VDNVLIPRVGNSSVYSPGGERDKSSPSCQNKKFQINKILNYIAKK